MVAASKPVASVMRLAALPVGAASPTESCRSNKARTMTRMMVVLPVPGPPVMTMSPAFKAAFTALRCSSDSVRPSSASYLPRSQSSCVDGASRSANRCAAMESSIRAR